MKKQQFGRAHTVAFCGLAVALITVSAWIILPFGMIPFTLQTLAIALVVLSFPPKQALASVFGYLALGAAGAPVFSGMKGGLAAFLGPTGGFLFGYALGALLAVALLKAWPQPQGKKAQFARMLSAGLALMISSYALGWLQLMSVADLGPVAAFAAGVAPFIAVDLVKVVVAARAAQSLRASIPQLRQVPVPSLKK